MKSQHILLSSEGLARFSISKNSVADATGLTGYSSLRPGLNELVQTAGTFVSSEEALYVTESSGVMSKFNIHIPYQA